jgi:hypothetical protein
MVLPSVIVCWALHANEANIGQGSGPHHQAQMTARRTAMKMLIPSLGIF